MASIISASTTSATALNLSGDTTGILQLATGATPTTAVTIDASQNVGIGTATTTNAKLTVNGLTAKVGDSISTGIYAMGDTNVTASYVGMYRGTAASISSGNWLNLGGYDGIAFTTGAAAIGSQTERMRIDSSGNVLVGGTTQNTATAPVYSSTTAKAWVNFNGTTATPSTIRASFNVTSVTKTGTGAYVVNFTNALVDANYVVNITTSSDSASIVTCGINGTNASMTTTACPIVTWSTTTQRDNTYVGVAVFR